MTSLKDVYIPARCGWGVSVRHSVEQYEVEVLHGAGTVITDEQLEYSPEFEQYIRFEMKLKICHLLNILYV